MAKSHEFWYLIFNGKKCILNKTEDNHILENPVREKK